MANRLERETAPRLSLWADTAGDLMTPNPVSLRDGATVEEARDVLIDKGFSAAPVIDEAGRPVGVLSQSDLLVHARACAPAESARAAGAGSEMTRARVRDLMTPAVFSVNPDTPVARVVADLLGLKVHHLFVVDGGGALVGVISALDILRALRS